MSLNRNCHQCGDCFKTSHMRKVFCSDRCRVAFHREHGLTCFYCGDRGVSKDHLFPQLFGDGLGEKINACRECNSTAGTITNLEERIIYIHNKYIKKYQLDVPIPDWSDEELAELGYTLRTSIKGKMEQRRLAFERAAHLKARLREIRRLS